METADNFRVVISPVTSQSKYLPEVMIDQSK
jgi:hypothetical protein